MAKKNTTILAIVGVAGVLMMSCCCCSSLLMLGGSKSDDTSKDISELPTNTVTTSTTTTAETTTEATTTVTIADKNIPESVISFLETGMLAGGDTIKSSVEYDESSNIYKISVTSDGTEDMAINAVLGTDVDKWNTIVDSYKDLSLTMAKTVRENYDETAHVAIMIASDKQDDKYYASVMDGSVVYNVLDDVPQTTTEAVSLSKKNALKSAQSYLKLSSFSYSGLIEQLEFEGYPHDDCVYAVDNCGADWNEQAAKSAQSYLELTSFSRSELIEQLKYEGFTNEQAEYGATAVGY